MMKQIAAGPNAVIFDLGGVLFDWNPRHLYRKLFDGREKQMEDFLSSVCTSAWNAEMDAGKAPATAVAELCDRWPEYKPLITAYRHRWEEMLGDVYEDNVSLMRELRTNLRCFALTNFAAENFVVARRRFPFLDDFDDILVSGNVNLAKPDPAIFKIAIDQFGVEPFRTIYVDDRPENAEVARSMNFKAIAYETNAQLRSELERLGVRLS